MRDIRSIVIASGNRHKFEEFQKLLAPLIEQGIDVVFGKDLIASLDVEETGSSFEENALLKAQAWADATGLPALADDSGIEVRALGWQPGIYSARFAPTNAQCRALMLSKLEGVQDRVGRYTVALALAFPKSEGRESVSPLVVLEHCWGRIDTKEQGTNGFGYDSIFIPDGYDDSFGVLSPEVKAVISHRAKASKAFVEAFKSL